MNRVFEVLSQENKTVSCMHFMQSEQGPLTYIHVYSYSDLNFKPTQIDYIPTIALKCVLGLRGELVPLEV